MAPLQRLLLVLLQHHRTPARTMTGSRRADCLHKLKRAEVADHPVSGEPRRIANELGHSPCAAYEKSNA